MRKAKMGSPHIRLASLVRKGGMSHDSLPHKILRGTKRH